jgi:hypothetical protein
MGNVFHLNGRFNYFGAISYLNGLVKDEGGNQKSEIRSFFVKGDLGGYRVLPPFLKGD